MDFWNVRFTEIAEIFRRAQNRGELRAGLEPVDLARMFTAAVCSEVIFTDSPVRERCADDLIGIFLRGVGTPRDP